MVYQEFRDLLKTGIDTNANATTNAITLTAHDQRALLLVGKIKLNDRTRLQAGLQQARLMDPSADVNIPHISSLYGETVSKSSAYSGDPIRINTYHIGIDYDLTEKLNVGASYVLIDLPRYDYLSSGARTQYLGGSIDALSGLAVYKLYTGTDLYGGFVVTHYSGDAFRDTDKFIYARNIFTAAAGMRFRF